MWPRPTERFSLEEYTGPSEAQPYTRPLLLDGISTGYAFPGELCQQYEVIYGYLLVSAWSGIDESTDFILLSPELKPLHQIQQAAWYSDWALKEMLPESEDRFRVRFWGDEGEWILTMLPPRFLRRRPRLKLKRAADQAWVSSTTRATP